MRWLPFVILLMSATASADRADDLVAEGQTLGKAGKLLEAVAKFREAEAIKPRPLHDCLIGLALFRSNEFAAAEIAFASCRRRAKANDPLPSWVDVEESALANKLAALGTVSVTVAKPLEKIEIAAIGPEPFLPPKRFHLPPGTHEVIARAGGREVRRTVDIAAQRHHTVVLKLEAEPPIAQEPVQQPPQPERPPARSRLPQYLMVGGGGALAIGLALHVFVVRPAYDDLDAAATGADYDDAYPKYRNARIATIGLYVAGAALATTGYVLHRRANVGAHVSRDQAMITLEWRR